MIQFGEKMTKNDGFEREMKLQLRFWERNRERESKNEMKKKTKTVHLTRDNGELL